jgi:hypothetical protein
MAAQAGLNAEHVLERQVVSVAGAPKSAYKLAKEVVEEVGGRK